MIGEFLLNFILFLSTPSARRATVHVAEHIQPVLVFLSTPSARRATAPTPHRARGRSISIHALREEGDYFKSADYIPQKISIHALREEGDPERTARETEQTISIHALREEGDVLHLFIQPSRPLFLSTPSARRATSAAGAPSGSQTISIHALREEGDRRRDAVGLAGHSISIHALREEGDRGACCGIILA